MQVTEIYNQLTTIIDPIHIKMNEPLKNYTYTKTGGNADIYITPIKYSEIQKTIQYANEHNITVTFLGNGSNIIIRDGGIRGIVISLLGLTDVQLSLIHI